MAYTEHAVALRRCRSLRDDGQPCRAFALWKSPQNLCAAHTYRKKTPNPLRWPAYQEKPTQAVACRCPAYNWPHRPGSGICRWPDQPVYRCTIPSGTKAWYKQ